MRILLFFLTAMITLSCTMESSDTFDLQGHRGARGLLPENTIPGFLKAVDLEVNTVEFDVVVTGDGQLLVSHEPWFSHLYSSKPDGTPVTEEEEQSFNIFEMTYPETQQFDVGKRGNPNFPDQQAMEVTKPLMRDAIRAIEQYAEKNNLPPLNYNIETKSKPEWYGEYVPGPEEFARLLHEELVELGVKDRTIIQSFDPATLIAFRKLAPDVHQAMLVSDNLSVDMLLNILGYTPEIWSPDYRLLDTASIDAIHQKGMKVIPWTVNSTEDMTRLVEMGADGLITDYPDRAGVLRETR